MTNEEIATIKDRIYALAEDRGFTAQQVEQACGLGAGTISKWGKSMPTADKLGKVADFLGVSIDTLMGRKINVREKYGDLLIIAEQLLLNPNMRALIAESEGLSDEDAQIFLSLIRKVKRGEN